MGSGVGSGSGSGVGSGSGSGVGSGSGSGVTVSFPPPSGSVREAIGALPELYRAVLELKFVAGYTNREIARMLGISESAVGTRILRGRAMLKEKLDAEGVSE